MSTTATGGPWSSRPCASSLARVILRVFRVDRRRQSYPIRIGFGSLAFRTPQARNRVLWRLSASRQAWVGHEIGGGVEGLLARRWPDPGRGPVRENLPALFVVLQIGHHDLIEHLLVHGRIEDRANHFDAAVEVARH